jgi:MFS transporter, SP family, sugar:H+ symporter
MKQDTGLIGGVLTMKAFQKSFHLNSKSKDFANLQGNIVSVLQAGCFFGAGSSFFISSWFGRKKALLIAVFFFLLGSTMQTCSGIGTTSLGLLYAGRVIGGYGVGIVSAAVPTYIGENANKEIRGRCIGIMQLFNVQVHPFAFQTLTDAANSTGIMLSYFVNYGVNLHITDGSSKTWRIPFALQMLPGVILGTGLLFQKESPRWLVEKGRVEEARHVLARVRARPIDDERITLELDEIIQDFHGKERLTFFQQGQAVFASKQILYPVSMALALQFFQQWSGTNSINYYSPQIFKSIGLSSTSAGLFATGIYGVVKAVMTGLSLALAIEQVGRKWCLIIGGLGQAFGMLYIGAHSAVHPTVQGAPLDGGSTFAIVCIYLYVAFYSLAWGHIPYILSSECSPNHVRSLVMAAALMLQWLCNFAIAKLTPIMLANITWGTFLVFGMSCILMATFAAIFVPETKNVPLETVHLLFDGRISTIVRNAFKDIRPKHQRAKELRERHLVSHVAEDRASSGDDEDLEKSRGKRQVEELLR